MSFWDKKGIKPQEVAYEEAAAAPMILNEEAIAEIQSDPQYDVFEEEETDTAELMSDANLRLEMGRLYQMVLQNDIFADTNADPRAVRNVQREIRKLVRERMEIMLGIKHEAPVQQTIVSFPFNDLEVTALKMLASKISNGRTEQVEAVPVAIPVQPKKDGITAISGTLRPKETTPLRKEAKITAKPQAQPKKATAKSAIKEDESQLQKPIEDMTAEELAAYDAKALERRSRNYAAKPPNLVPHPSPQALEMMYASQVASNPAPGSAVARMTDLINGRN